MDKTKESARILKKAAKAELLWSYESKGNIKFLIERYLCPKGQRILPPTPNLMIGFQLGGKKVSTAQPYNLTDEAVISIPSVTLLYPGVKESRWFISSYLDFVMIYFRGDAQEQLHQHLKNQDEPLALTDNLIGNVIKQLAMLFPCEDVDNNSLVHIDALAQTLLQQIFYLLKHVDNYRAIDTESTQYPFIQKTITYIHEHLDESLLIDELAEQAGLQQSYFREIFKRVTGCSLHKFITKVRLERAQELLSTTNMSISIIAEDLGFSSQSHLTTLFTRQYDISPGKFRRLKIIK